MLGDVFGDIRFIYNSFNQGWHNHCDAIYKQIKLIYFLLTYYQKSGKLNQLNLSLRRNYIILV